MVLFTLFTILPQTLFTVNQLHTKPINSCGSKVAKFTLVFFAMFGLHQLVLIYTPMGRLFQRVEKDMVHRSRSLRVTL